MCKIWWLSVKYFTSLGALATTRFLECTWCDIKSHTIYITIYIIYTQQVGTKPKTRSALTILKRLCESYHYLFTLWLRKGLKYTNFILRYLLENHPLVPMYWCQLCWLEIQASTVFPFYKVINLQVCKHNTKLLFTKYDISCQVKNEAINCSYWCWWRRGHFISLVDKISSLTNSS